MKLTKSLFILILFLACSVSLTAQEGFWKRVGGKKTIVTAAEVIGSSGASTGLVPADTLTLLATQNYVTQALAGVSLTETDPLYSFGFTNSGNDVNGFISGSWNFKAGNGAGELDITSSGITNKINGNTKFKITSAANGDGLIFNDGHSQSGGLGINIDPAGKRLHVFDGFYSHLEFEEVNFYPQLHVRTTRNDFFAEIRMSEDGTNEDYTFRSGEGLQLLLTDLGQNIMDTGTDGKFAFGLNANNNSNIDLESEGAMFVNGDEAPPPLMQGAMLNYDGNTSDYTELININGGVSGGFDFVMLTQGGVIETSLLTINRDGTWFAPTIASAAGDEYIAYNSATGQISRTNSNPSDRRLKENIVEIENALAKVNCLTGYNYTWKARPELGEQMGLIAQEVEEYFPQMVRYSDDGMMGLRYEQMTAALVQAVNELTARVEELENK